jgi:hypothetical protein
VIFPASNQAALSPTFCQAIFPVFNQAIFPTFNQVTSPVANELISQVFLGNNLAVILKVKQLVIGQEKLWPCPMMERQLLLEHRDTMMAIEIIQVM